MVANPVTDQSSLMNLPKAEEYSKDQVRDNDRNRYCIRFLVFGGVPLVAAGIVLLLVLLLADRENGTGAANANATNLAASPSPSWSVTDFQALLPDDTQIAILVEDSPQSMALEWIRKDPWFTKYSDWRMIQRFALATLY